MSSTAATEGSASWGESNMAGPTPHSPSKAEAPSESMEDFHPIRLARTLGEKWAGLSEAARNVCLEELMEAGVIKETAPTISAVERFVRLDPGEEETAELKMDVLRTRLKMLDARYARTLSLSDVLDLLLDLACHVSRLNEMLSSVWPVWQGIAKHSRLRPSVDQNRSFEALLRDVLSGLDQGESLNSVLKDQVTSARLLIAMLTALGQGSQEFARECSAFIDPEGIRRSLNQGKKKAATSEEMWAKYVQLSYSLTPGEIEHRLQKHIVDAAEAFFHATQRH